MCFGMQHGFRHTPGWLPAIRTTITCKRGLSSLPAPFACYRPTQGDRCSGRAPATDALAQQCLPPQHPQPPPPAPCRPLLGVEPSVEAPPRHDLLAPSGVEAEASQLEAERSLLSRRGSLSNLHDECAATETHQLTLCEKAGTGFAATLMIGMLATVAIVLVAVPAPFGGGTPRCRRAAAIAVAPAGANISQDMVVWSGRGQGGTVYHDWLHVLRWVPVWGRSRRPVVLGAGEEGWEWLVECAYALSSQGKGGYAARTHKRHCILHAPRRTHPALPPIPCPQPDRLLVAESKVGGRSGQEAAEAATTATAAAGASIRKCSPLAPRSQAAPAPAPRALEGGSDHPGHQGHAGAWR